MKRSFHRPINAVRFRQRIQRTLNYAAWGTFLAALVALFSPMLAGVVFGISILLGLIRSHPFSAAARLIDRHYHLKDRILTATALLRRNNQTSMEQLQIADTAEHLPNIRPQAVYPIRLPKVFFLAAAVFILEFTVDAVLRSNFFSSTGNAESVIQILPIDDTILQEEILAKIEELVQQHPNEPSLLKLAKQLEMSLDNIDWSKMDIKESLATLSEMEEAFQTALDALQLETMEESLQELAKTLELAEKTEPIGKALENGDYGQAATELKKLDASMLESLTKPEQIAIAEQMKTIAENAEKRNQKPLQEAAEKMSDALANGDGEQGKSATDALANEVEKHGVRQGIGKNLANQQMLLGMIKSENGPGNMSGGKGTDKSETESQTWGSGAAGNPNAGKETDLQGQRQQETLTGTMSEEGDSLTETVDSQEMMAARSLLDYREQYQQYQKLSEAVLDAEPIPLGQRQVIRRYFEAIRPNEID